MKILYLMLTLLLAAGLMTGCAAPAVPTTPGSTASPAPSTPTGAPYPVTSPTPPPAAYPVVTPTTPVEIGPAPTPADVPFAVQQAVKFLAQSLKITPDQVTLIAYDQMEFSDACLGVVVKGEACAQLITPGYIIQAQAQGRNYELHTDLNGGTTRIVP